MTHVTIPVPPNLYNDCAWLGLALIASFEINVNEVAILDIQDSEASFKLICYLGSDIEVVKPFHTYDLTKENLKLLHQGGFIWLCYIPRESFQDSLNQCSWIKALIQTNCPGLTVQKLGLHLSYDHDEAETKRCCKSFFPHRLEVRSSIPSSSNNDDAQTERQRQRFNDEAGPRRTRCSIEDLHQEIPRKPIYKGETSKAKQLGENDPHPKDQHYQSDLLVINKLLSVLFASNIIFPLPISNFSYTHSLDTIFLFHRTLIDALPIVLVCFNVKFWSGSGFRVMSPN